MGSVDHTGLRLSIVCSLHLRVRIGPLKDRDHPLIHLHREEGAVQSLPLFIMPQLALNSGVLYMQTERKLKGQIFLLGGNLIASAIITAEHSGKGMSEGGWGGILSYRRF